MPAYVPPTKSTGDPFQAAEFMALANALVALESAVTALTTAAPTLLNTFDEIANALGDDPNFATTVLNLLAGKASTTALTTGLSGKADISSLQSIGSGPGIDIINGLIRVAANGIALEMIPDGLLTAAKFASGVLSSVSAEMPKYTARTSDSTARANVSTYLNDDQLSLTIPDGNATWDIEGLIFYTAPVASGIRISFAAGTGGLRGHAGTSDPNAATGTNTKPAVWKQFSGFTDFMYSGGHATDVLVMRPKFKLRVVGTGTLVIPRFTQNVQTADAGYVIKQDSYLTATKIQNT